ncbi:hypothetical protein LEMLEM_LOCUS5839 [Lemmus lemmus]
MPLLCQSIWQ